MIRLIQVKIKYRKTLDRDLAIPKYKIGNTQINNAKIKSRKTQNKKRNRATLIFIRFIIKIMLIAFWKDILKFTTAKIRIESIKKEIKL